MGSGAVLLSSGPESDYITGGAAGEGWYFIQSILIRRRPDLISIKHLNFFLLSNRRRKLEKGMIYVG
jgi:hypothetical protein